MDILIKVVQFILSLSILILVHELGHFAFARIFGVRVDRFSLFLGKPWVSIKHGDTKYCIGWLPFGGYVKLSGMIDESMDTKHVAQEPKPYEFRSKPCWQRLLIMTGGVMMNVVLAFVIYAFMTYTWGESYISNKDAAYGYVFSENMHVLGFEDGDRIISVNGVEYDDISKLVLAMILEPGTPVVVERGKHNELITLHIPASKVMDIGNNPNMLSVRYPFVIRDVMEGGGAQRAGLQSGDRLVALNGESIEYFDEYARLLPDYSGQSVEIGFVRDSVGVNVLKSVVVDVSDQGMIGVNIDIQSVTPTHRREFTFLESIPTGANRVVSEIGGYWKQLKFLVKPEAEGYKAIGGPLAIGSIFPSHWNWYSFWHITAFLSIVLAVMNLLPIPGLDGGHVIFLLYEMITRRKPTTRVLITAQMVGMWLLLSIMVLAMWNDITRLFIK